MKAYYEINKEQISQNRCVNKDITGVQCFGKCYFNKTIDLAKKAKGENASDKENLSLSYEYISPASVDTSFELGELMSNTVFDTYDTSLDRGAKMVLTKPPIC